MSVQSEWYKFNFIVYKTSFFNLINWKKTNFDEPFLRKTMLERLSKQLRTLAQWESGRSTVHGVVMTRNPWDLYPIL